MCGCPPFLLAKATFEDFKKETKLNNLLGARIVNNRIRQIALAGFGAVLAVGLCAELGNTVKAGGHNSGSHGSYGHNYSNGYGYRSYGYNSNYGHQSYGYSYSYPSYSYSYPSYGYSYPSYGYSYNYSPSYHGSYFGHGYASYNGHSGRR
jgi:hypothetical protein